MKSFAKVSNRQRQEVCAARVAAILALMVQIGSSLGPTININYNKNNNKRLMEMRVMSLLGYACNSVS
jgi:hypothetical protein